MASTHLFLRGRLGAGPNTHLVDFQNPSSHLEEVTEEDGSTTGEKIRWLTAIAINKKLIIRSCRVRVQISPHTSVHGNPYAHSQQPA